MSDFDYIMDWDRYGKKGELCQILPTQNRGQLVQVRFQDGTTGLINRQAIRRAKPSEKKAAQKTVDAKGKNRDILAPSGTGE